MAMHGEMNKDDPTNPTVSYGVLGNYRCYQIGELLDSWVILPDGSFTFTVPDFQLGRIDPTTGSQLIAHFPIESIRQLNELLDTAPASFDPKIIADLKAKIQEGFDAQNEELRRIRQLRLQYEAFTPEQKSIVNTYLGWVFMFGFWMRFWRGPGFPWTVTREEMRRQAGGRMSSRGYGICELERDEHSAIQHILYARLRDMYSADPVLRAWIEALPQGLTKNWNYGEWHLGSPLTEFIVRLTLGACQQGGGSYIPMSGYFLITRVLGLGTADGFNAFMNQTIPSVNELEKQVVTNRLAQAAELGLSHRQIETLRERQRALNTPFTGQPPFNPRQMDEVPDTDLP
jgi:hypothetical protein